MVVFAIKMTDDLKPPGSSAGNRARSAHGAPGRRSASAITPLEERTTIKEIFYVR